MNFLKNNLLYMQNLLMQQLIVIVIGVLVFGYVVYQTYKTLTNKSTSSDVKCGGCNSCSPISEK